MHGIDLNSPIQYEFASFRFFEKKEHHIERFCCVNVLLMVYEGVLRFSEDGEQVEVGAGEYYIQRKNRYQAGELPSDAPHYLFVHFDGEWSEQPDALPYRGSFDYTKLSELMQQIDTASHQKYVYAEQQYLFHKLLLSLRQKMPSNTLADRLSKYVEENIAAITSLADLCEAFHYSMNYVERLFQREFGVSPIHYINDVKIKKAMYLLETTSKPISEISEECGYFDYPYFFKRFVQKTGVSPSEWRKIIQRNPANRDF
ncbi:MAG: helix-turn-helix transcriptional regulator [Clostridia bacterium]|nr:helix-turn-helix transcriptional regulator [Clostridia bacterium]